MVLEGVAAGIGVGVTVGLAAAAVAGRALTARAGAVAAAFGIAIVVLAGFPFLVLLALFVVASALATHYRFEEKRQRSVQEGARGERDVSNVVAHIVIPTGIAVAIALRPGQAAPLAVLFASALAFGGADTFASEFGVLAGGARSIVTLRPVAPGTNGGISATGEGFALLAAGLTAGVGEALFALFRTPFGGAVAFAGIVTFAGFVACQIDSVVGELLENRGWVGKGGTNFLAMLSAVAIAAGLWAALGGRA